jgi:hypothetical protein
MEHKMSPDGAPISFRSGQQVPVEQLTERHRPLVDPSRPIDFRLRIAKGLLPAAVEDLIPTLCFLTQDPNGGVRSAACDTIRTMPDDQLIPVIQSIANIYVIDGLARTLLAENPLIPELAVNRYTHDSTLVFLAGNGSRRTCDVIGRNAQRALGHTPIVEALFFNPRASQGTVQELLELAVREDIDLDHMPGFRETKAALLGEHGARDDKTGTELDELEFLSAMEFAFDDELGTKAADVEENSGRKVNLQTAIMSMSVAQKIRLSLVGDANARKLLVRDPKKMVAMAVLKSPRLTDGEVRIFATKKELAEEVVATIARNRSWTRDYQVRKALLFNPKCPQSMALAFLRSMVESDIKMIAKHRDVPGGIRRAAKRIIDQKVKAKAKARSKKK